MKKLLIVIWTVICGFLGFCGWFDCKRYGIVFGYNDANLQARDELCKCRGWTLIDDRNNVFGVKREIKLHKKSIHMMNKIGF